MMTREHFVYLATVLVEVNNSHLDADVAEHLGFEPEHPDVRNFCRRVMTAASQKVSSSCGQEVGDDHKMLLDVLQSVMIEGSHKVQSDAHNDEYQTLVDACCRLLRALSNRGNGAPFARDEMFYMPDTIAAMADFIERCNPGESILCGLMSAAKGTAFTLPERA